MYMYIFTRMYVVISCFILSGDQAPMKKMEKVLLKPNNDENSSTATNTSTPKRLMNHENPRAPPARSQSKTVKKCDTSKYNYKKVSAYEVVHCTMFMYMYMSLCTLCNFNCQFFIQPTDKFVMELGSPSQADYPPPKPSQSKSGSSTPDPVVDTPKRSSEPAPDHQHDGMSPDNQLEHKVITFVHHNWCYMYMYIV